MQRGRNTDDTDTVVITLYDYLEVIRRRSRLIGVIIGSAVVCSVIISLILPNRYVARTSIIPPQDGSLPVSASMMSSLPSSFSSIASGLLGSSTQSDLWVGIIKSRNVGDAIIERFNLMELCGKDTMVDTRRELAKNINVDSSDEGIITLTVEDLDPERAAEMANAFAEQLDRVNKELVVSSGGRMRSFVQKRLAEAAMDLRETEELIRAFQAENKAVKLDEQSRAIIEAIGSVKGELMSNEVELHTLLSYATPSNPRVQLLKARSEQLRRKLNELDVGSKGGEGRSVLIPTSEIPDLALRYARLLRDVKIQETLFELLTQQYEMARIQEASDRPTVEVLDRATPPDKKAKPRRLLIVFLSTFLSVFVGIFTVFTADYFERAREAAGRDA